MGESDDNGSSCASKPQANAGDSGGPRCFVRQASIPRRHNLDGQAFRREPRSRTQDQGLVTEPSFLLRIAGRVSGADVKAHSRSRDGWIGLMHSSSGRDPRGRRIPANVDAQDSLRFVEVLRRRFEGFLSAK
jgi:hypothetical protein